MGWHYSAKRFKRPNEDDFYAIVESYPDLGEKVHTVNPICPEGESLEKLEKQLKLMLNDILKYKVLDDET